MSESTLRVLMPGDSKADSFELAILDGRRRVSTGTRPWQPGDKQAMFRAPLSPWTGGLYVDRMSTSATYAKANADASNHGMLLHPPKVNEITFTNGTSTVGFEQFDGKVFVLRGRYVYTIDPTDYSVTEDKDFGSGNAGVAMAVFNNELIVAMGASTKIQKRAVGGTWTEATNDTFAIALGVVGSKLWRAESPNEISSCASSPLTLANWVPADPNQYTVGDSTHSVTRIRDYGGIPWVGKPTGMYAPDPRTQFLNQTPQIANWPDDDNCKGAFTAQGFLFVPSAPGLLRIQPGASRSVGPELTFRPDYRFVVRDGIEWGGAIYLLVNDACNCNPFIAKMIRDTAEQTPNDYIYHEWARLGGAGDTGTSIIISTLPTNPTLFADTGDTVKYILLGRGGGRDIDDDNYAYGTSMELETGVISPESDRSVVVQPVGVEVVLDYSGDDESLVMSGRVDGEAYTELLNDQGKAGTAVIARTDGIESVRRYWPANVRGQHLEVKFASTLVSATGTGRPEIYEATCFGYLHPKQVRIVTATIDATRAPHRYRSHQEILDYFLSLLDNGLEVRVSRPGGGTMNAVVTVVTEYEQDATLGPEGTSTEPVSVVEVEFSEVIHSESAQ